VQAPHVDPYSAEGETIEKILEFAKEKEFKVVGVYHEIYL